MTSMRLAIGARPVVMFDEHNKDHRKLVSEFIATGSWATCPVRFAYKDNSAEQLPSILNDLVRYYTSQEFKGKRA